MAIYWTSYTVYIYLFLLVVVFGVLLFGEKYIVSKIHSLFPKQGLNEKKK